MKLRKVRLLTAFMVFVFIFSLAVSAFCGVAEASGNTITVGSASGTVGQTVFVAVTASNITMAGYQLEVNYDSEYLAPQAVVNDIGFGNWMPNIAYEAGKMRFLWNHSENVVVGAMFTVEFLVLKDISGSSVLYVDSAAAFNEVTDENVNPVAVTYEPPVPVGEGGELEEAACYIATAVYGSYDADEVVVLRNFRDDVLAKSLFGRFFIKTYYTLSPPVANFLAGAESLNGWVRVILDGFVDYLSCDEE